MQLLLPWPESEFGCGVRYSLKGRLDDPEFLIGGDRFHAMMREKGLIQNRWINMAEFLAEELQKPRAFQEWHSFGTTVKQFDWDVASLYVCGVFRKE